MSRRRRAVPGRWVPGSAAALVAAKGLSKKPGKLARSVLPEPPDGPITGPVIQEVTRSQAWNAVQTLAAVAGDLRASPSARVAAAVAILDRGFGKPVAPVAAASLDGGPLAIEVRFSAPDDKNGKGSGNDSGK